MTKRERAVGTGEGLFLQQTPEASREPDPDEERTDQVAPLLPAMVRVGRSRVRAEGEDHHQRPPPEDQRAEDAERQSDLLDLLDAHGPVPYRVGGRSRCWNLTKRVGQRGIRTCRRWPRDPSAGISSGRTLGRAARR